jgi:hypothetical protein
MTPDEGGRGRDLEVDWNCRDRCRSYVPDLFGRRVHNLVLAPAQLKHDGGSSSVPAAGMGLRMPGSRYAARAMLHQRRNCCGLAIELLKLRHLLSGEVLSEASSFSFSSPQAPTSQE